MLAYGLDWCERAGIELPGRNGLQRARADLADGDVLSVAEKLQRGLRRDAQWGNFIADTFSTIPLRSRDLLEAIVSLDAPLATTNYDTLIETVSGQPPVSWRSPAVFQRALLDRSIGIAHMHGVWTDPDSVVLGSEDYGALLASAHAQALERAMFLRSSVLFIGCGAGLDDPNFSSLRRHLLEAFGGTPLTHYYLTTAAEAQNGPVQFDRRESIKPIVYGDQFEDLVGFLTDIVRDISTGGDVVPAFGGKVEPKSRATLLNMPLLRGASVAGPTLAQLWPDLILESRIRPLRSLTVAASDISTWLARQRPSHVVLIGGAGAGKSTLLRRLAIEGTAATAEAMPVFLTAAECVGLRLGDVPADGTVLIDGLDEASESGLQQIAAFLRSLGARPWWVSCRAEFFSRASAVRALLSGADEILELQPLLEQQVNEFIDSFVRQADDAETGRTLASWQESADFIQLVTNPLHLIVAVITASHHAEGVTADLPRTRYALYSMFYDHLLTYESDRHGLDQRETGRVVRGHVKLASQIYSRRQQGRKPPSLPIETNREKTWPAMSSILNVFSSADRLVIPGFAHETFSEFVLAQDLVRSVIAKASKMRPPTIAFNDDVNGFVREAFDSFGPPERERALSKLTRAYHDSADPREREHVLYYIGRLGLDSCPEVLQVAYRAEPSPVARRSAALGAILYGDLDIEADYMGTVLQSDEEDLLNRSVQLVYFGDMIGNLHDARDEGQDWSRTRRALMLRVADVSVRSRRLRWWDLYTLLCFFRSRDAAPSSAECAAFDRVLTEATTDASRDVAIRGIIADLVVRRAPASSELP
ncbi:SIR2 family protein [Kribbella sp. NPDC056345]|uniref:SIR2 family protein n=1 Tax=Kribbella sp. NPDC056345 TaxID=3345789 RepID=UPI0035E2AE3F